MQAFKVIQGKNSWYFCSLECAGAGGFKPQDGEFALEADYSVHERCINCAVHMNDQRRSLLAYPATQEVDWFDREHGTGALR